MSANAIERIDRCLRNPVIPNQYDADARDALAALEALLEAANEVARIHGGKSRSATALAAAVRRVETGQ